MSKRVEAALWFARICMSPFDGKARRRVGVVFMYLCYIWALWSAVWISLWVAVLTFGGILVDFHRTIQADVACLKIGTGGDTAAIADDEKNFRREWEAFSKPTKIIVGDDGGEK